MNKKIDTDNTETIGKLAASLSLIEIGLGSFLHSFKVPFSGHLLSINQIAILSRSSFKLNSIKSSLQISLVAALLKSLSPAGKKLTPMLAISAQGLFFYSGLSLLGINYIGLFFAVLLSSLWAIVQPVLFIFFIFGKNAITVSEYYLREFERIIPHVDQYLMALIIGFVFLKFILAYSISLIAIKISDEDFYRYQNKMLMETKEKTVKEHSAFFLALRDLFNPLFIISFFMTLSFFLFSHSSISNVQMIWFILRPVAFGFILFYIVRVYPVKNLSHFLARNGFHQLGKILDFAIETIRKNKEL